MTDEVTRLVRTLIQALAGAAVAWLASQGIDIDVEPLVAVLFPLAIVATTAVVKFVSDRVPFLGGLIGWLNGPRREVAYFRPPEPD